MVYHRWVEVAEMPDLDSASGEIVGDQAPVALPPQGFGTHEHERRLASEGGHQRLTKLWRFHVVRVAAERRDPPGAVNGVGRRIATAAEVHEMRVRDVGRVERVGQRVTAEPRMPARARESAYVDECGDPVWRQEAHEIVDRARRMPDRIDRGRRVRDVVERDYRGG